MEKHVEKEDRVTYRLISEADDEWLQVGRSPVSEVAVWTQSPRVLCSRRRDGFHPKGRTTTYHQFRNADRGHKTLLIWVVPLKFVPHGNTSADFFSLSLPLCNSNLSIFPPILCPLPRYTSLHIQKKFIPILIVVISNSFNYKFNLFIIYKPNTLLKKKGCIRLDQATSILSLYVYAVILGWGIMYAVVQTQQIGDPHQGTSLPNPVVIDSRHDGGLVPFMGPTKFNTRLHFHLLRIYRFYTSIRHRYTRLCIYIYIFVYIDTDRVVGFWSL